MARSKSNLPSRPQTKNSKTTPKHVDRTPDPELTTEDYKSIAYFLDRHFSHYNASALLRAARAWSQHTANGGKMMLTIAGAMSTAEMGAIISEMIRANQIHAICSTGANLEEDIYYLIAAESYKDIPEWNDLSNSDESRLHSKRLPRVNDTVIPEDEAMWAIEKLLLPIFQEMDSHNIRIFPHELFYYLYRSNRLSSKYESDPRDSWVCTAADHNIPIFVPGWEDSSAGNYLAACILDGKVANPNIIKSGVEYMLELSRWYMRETNTGTDLDSLKMPLSDLEFSGLGKNGTKKESEDTKSDKSDKSKIGPIGFFQIGGGIAGDFPICAVPLLNENLEQKAPLWGYFAQISDSPTSYGSYSGADPSEKITWGKLHPDTPQFVIESDATIVFPLICAYVLAHLDNPSKDAKMDDEDESWR